MSKTDNFSAPNFREERKNIHRHWRWMPD